MIRDAATQAQVDAARPDANTWLSANAGSGKTRVLTDRVARLLLAEVEPQNILCLTYTKAAASEMQNRLFSRLGAWAMMADGALTDELTELGLDIPGDLARARRLFARAIETPGGLKIQTIHAFCASILRRFPMEAGVSPDFKEMDDRAGKLLREEIVESMAEGVHRPIVETLARHYTGMDFAGLTANIVGNRIDFLEPTDPAAIREWLNLPADFSEGDVVAEVFSPDAKDLIRAVIPVLAHHSSTMVTMSGALATINLDAPSMADFNILASVVLTQKGELRKSQMTKPAATELGNRADHFVGLAERVFDQMEMVRALRTADRTAALHAFAHPFVIAYEAAKAQRGWVDFDDLIQRAAALLSTSDVAQWVLFRLDGGIDHILVDEAQDTSPDQWRVIDCLAREFMSGQGAHVDRTWSIFVVGDPKQSIYSFQGADPAKFAEVRDDFAARLGEVQRPLAQLPLRHSFRSAPAILTAVDEALGDMPGLGDTRPDHLAFHTGRAGRVDLWPVLEKTDEPEPNDWHDPVDLPSPKDHIVELAECVADEISRMVETEQVFDKDGFRPIKAGDVLVLVQRRSPLFHNIIRTCKAKGLPIAGADRLKIGGEMAVKDLTALLNFLATPEDDLSLAAVLRSPIFGWTEDELFRLAYGRKGYLWKALRDSNRADTMAIIDDLLSQADYMRPYDLLDRVLTRHDGRRRLIGRLGAEAEDGIDAMLAQALGYERLEVPSLTGFLTWLAAEEVEIKRQMDSQRDEIRVMTVHGAKGLEAPIVFLPDTAKRDARPRGEIMRANGGAIWRPKSADMPASLAEVHAAQQARDEEERMRLLYVAMTRAESWLVVAAAGDAGKEATSSWHAIVQSGLLRLDATTRDTPTGLGLRYQTGDWPTPKPQEVERKADLTPTLPDWVERHAVTPPRPSKPLTPSTLGGDKVVFSAGEGLDAEAAKRRGRQIHRLLEFLPEYPQSDWPDHAKALLAFGEDAARGNEVDDLLSEVTSVLTNPDLTHLFDGNALAEVDVSAPTTRGGATRLHGTIDRLIIAPDRVVAIDFKSNMTTPDSAENIPTGILRQMGAYGEALAHIYPTREIALAVLWTRSGILMDVPVTIANTAYGTLDADGVDT